GGLVPAILPPELQAQIAEGLRSGAPLAAALETLPLPATGMHANWSVVGSPFAVGPQSAENATIPPGAGGTAASTHDLPSTLSVSSTWSRQASELSGGWFDRLLADELAAALAARLEASVWNGLGTGGDFKGFLQASGTSSSTVAAQTLPGV